MRRVVVTGMGLVSPLGSGVNIAWKHLLEGKSGISAITDFDVSDMPARIAGQVPLAGDGAFRAEDHLSSKEIRKIDRFIVYALAAANEAVVHACWEPQDESSKCRTGVMIGSGIGGLTTIQDSALLMQEKGPRRLSPFFIPASLINLASGHVSIKHGFKGPNHAVVTACASGAHAIGDAARLIMLDDADVMIAGGAEAGINRLGLAGFSAARALSTSYNDTPESASRPFDKGRDGFVMGEGSGILVLEELEHAKARGATIYAEVIGYGMSGDAYHITSPAEDGDGAYRAMQAAVRRANIKAQDIDYINAHGTSTPLGDDIEMRAVKRLMGDATSHMSMSSTKSATGHLLGAAGAIEAIFSVLSIRDQIAPPTLNLEDPSEEATGLDLVPHVAKKQSINVVLSNSFGFGGTNASLVFRKYKG